MSRLFKLREWLTPGEAAAHISSILGEPVGKAELYRFALDGHLTLSVDFVNKTYVRKGKWHKNEQYEMEIKELLTSIAEKRDMPIPEEYEKKASKGIWTASDESVQTISGVWDLSMIGNEKLDIEHKYQQETYGPDVTLTNIDGTFVQKGDVVCQLQEDFEDNEMQLGSKANEKALKEHIATEKIHGDAAKKIWGKYKKAREKYLEKRRNQPRERNYYPAGSLPEDSVLVVRTNEITRFIQSLEDTPETEKPLTSKERNSLLVLIGALCKEVDIDPKERGVATSLVHMTEELGAPLTDDTIRKILNQIDEAVELRTK